ncbi:NADH-quinone oxidoreductase subunit NuoH [Puerhibacterium sp. TATVAM-FAB25]|uniref:NADH-quinone oxidoreductase subunit NuoH n=1 Tax=Puerhibacterium sp. TATVAM-FAB25 TaxID=3093699 RepID=UPI0039796C3A
MIPGVAADFSQDTIWVSVVKAVLIVVFLLLSVLVAIWFERKVVARMQVRPGPNVHGPFGLLQSLADAMKLLLKEDVNVTAADRVVYLLAPMVSVFCALLVFAVVPFGPEVTVPFIDLTTPAQLTDFPVAVLYVLACASVGVYGIVLGGWSSGSTYPLLGAVRSTAQVISYELAMGLSLVSVFVMAGSMSTSSIVESQTRLWWFLPLLPAFAVYVVSMIGETNRLPFDLPEAEGELVSGYMTEYSSMKFAWFFLAEYINMLNVSAICTTLFLGGWRAPWPLSAVGDGVLNTGWWPVLWFLAKLWALMFVFVWVRGTLLRLRYDQFMVFGWKVLIPVALAWVVVLSVVQWLRGADVVGAGTGGGELLLTAVAVAFLALVVAVLRPGRARRRPDAALGVGRTEHAPPTPDPFVARSRVLDPFAGGYPVPPLPGQHLPPSPRAARRGGAPDVVDPGDAGPRPDEPVQEEYR